MKTACTNLVLGLLALTAASCRQSPPAADATPGPDVVAVVAGRPVTRAALEAELARRGPGATKEAALADLIRFEATLAKLKGSGFDRDPQTVLAVERLLVARYEERELAGTETPAVTEEEIRAAYAADAARYAVPAAVRGSVLFLKASAKAAPERRAEQKRRAEQLLALAGAADAAGFERLVREHSDDQSTRYRGGDTGWLNAGADTGGWDAAVVGALRTLQQPGELAPLIETPGGFYLARLTETKAAGVRPLAEVGEAIRHQLRQAKREQLTAAFQTRMCAGLDIRTNTAALAETLVTVRADQQPPRVP